MSDNLFSLFVYTSKTDALDLNTIAKEFVSVNNRIFELLNFALKNNITRFVQEEQTP